ncbi:riboflavin synthase [Solimonas terrae]|uniref:Riboflavin synthase n=1 Tax=Solimonas terrae TaxID=1396819 RepID=A0A6M2BMU7_9GAMM|nr:riboflavin synthase [Solimonas terrae]NGY03485.1 riboflavin synthase [Solimonas terrae]
MFTGIIEALGSIADIEVVGGDCRMRFTAPGLLAGTQIGDSIAVNGVCLTATRFVDDGFVADLSAETLKLTTAGGWQSGAAVNLERALTPSKPLGGHMVVGHVDGTGTLLERFGDARSTRMRFELPQGLARYVARKGSICIDGVSLTVNDVEGARFGVNIIPHTLTHTTLGRLQPGQVVNLEVDLLARYLERLLDSRNDVV